MSAFLVGVLLAACAAGDEAGGGGDWPDSSGWGTVANKRPFPLGNARWVYQVRLDGLGARIERGGWGEDVFDAESWAQVLWPDAESWELVRGGMWASWWVVDVNGGPGGVGGGWRWEWRWGPSGGREGEVVVQTRVQGVGGTILDDWEGWFDVRPDVR